MKILKISQIIVGLLAFCNPIAAVGQGSLVEGILKHTNGYLTIYPYSASYDDGTFVKAYYDGNNNRLMFVNSAAGGQYTGLMAGKIIAMDKVGIGTYDPQATLAVNGNILAKEVKIKTDISVPDYVFDPDYELATLQEVEAFVKEHRHLPEVPSASDIQRNGLDLAEMNLLLLKKVEELTLHLIEMDKKTVMLMTENKLLREHQEIIDSQLVEIQNVSQRSSER